MLNNIKSKNAQSKILGFIQIYCLYIIINCALNSTIYTSNSVIIIIILYIVAELRQTKLDLDIIEEINKL